ncbi:MAG: RNA methyltransferase [Clostridia bacterium]|nr:RNA methyltransferase [Clostridia bacterium]
MRIESRSNPTIKNMISLRDRREREEKKLFCFEGVHLLEEYLRAGNKPYALFVREDAEARYAELIGSAGCEVYTVTESVYEKLSEERAPQGIFTVSRYCEGIVNCGTDGYSVLCEAIKGNSVMLVDLQDNGNVGTVIRTAAALDCAVLLCGRCADIYSAKTVRATMGALFTADIFICPDTDKALDALAGGGVRVIASALDESAVKLGEFEVKGNDCFAVGNEGQGLSADFISKSAMTCFIPMSDKTESLNAASAASMLLWEARRGKR